MSPVYDLGNLQSLVTRLGEIEYLLEKHSDVLEKGFGFQVTACIPDDPDRRVVALTDDHVRQAIEWQMQSLAIERGSIRQTIQEMMQ